MDLTGMNHQGMLSQNENLHWRTPHATRYVQSRDQQVHSTYRGAQDTDSSLARTASSDHRSSNSFYPNMLSGCADESILAVPETVSGNVFEASAHAYQFYQSATELLQMQPQEDNDLSQMNFVPSTTGESQENH